MKNKLNFTEAKSASGGFTITLTNEMGDTRLVRLKTREDYRSHIIWEECCKKVKLFPDASEEQNIKNAATQILQMNNIIKPNEAVSNIGTRLRDMIYEECNFIEFYYPQKAVVYNWIKTHTYSTDYESSKFMPEGISKPQKTSKIIDENKSVKWNKEQSKRLNIDYEEQKEIYEEAKRKAEVEAMRAFENDLAAVMANAYQVPLSLTKGLLHHEDPIYNRGICCAYVSTALAALEGIRTAITAGDIIVK